MTAPPIVALSAERDPRAEAVVTGGLAAFNKAAFGRVDAQTPDVVVCDDNSGEIAGGLLGHSSLGCSFSTSSTCRNLCAALSSAAALSLSQRTRRDGAAALPPLSTPSRFRRPASTSGTASGASARSLARRLAPPGFF